MRLTRRCRALVASALVLAALGAVVEQPLLLVGGAGVGAVVLAAQYRFVRHLQALDSAVAVGVTVPQQYVTEGETTPVTLRAATTGTPLSATVEASVPSSADAPPADERRARLTDGEPVSTTFDVGWPVAGVAAFAPPTITVRDRHGLFTETFERGQGPRVTVEPRTASSLHVGQGGDRTLATFGEHATDEIGEGLDPAELRQYVPGDSARDIDWKATARLDEPYVREHEIETDREAVYLVDHREALGTGQPGETKLDYIREIALAFAAQARAYDDPLGLYAIGDGGVTAEFHPGTTDDHYGAIRDALYELTPTDGDTDEPDTADPGAARSAASRLQADQSAFGATLAPYFAETEGYVQRIAADPLFRAAQTYLTGRGGTEWVFLFTDDTARTELRETVKHLRNDGAHVVVFLTPAVLFEPGGLADLDAAYERYSDFESFRRSLAKMDRVSAYEVGPRDRLDAVLDGARA